MQKANYDYATNKHAGHGTVRTSWPSRCLFSPAKHGRLKHSLHNKFAMAFNPQIIFFFQNSFAKQDLSSQRNFFFWKSCYVGLELVHLFTDFEILRPQSPDHFRPNLCTNLATHNLYSSKYTGWASRPCRKQ